MEHAITNYPSRLDLGESVDGVKNDFSNRSLFHIEAANSIEVDQEPNEKWLNDMLYFLTTGSLPQNMQQDEKKILAIRSPNFCVLKETHKGADGIWHRVV